MARLIFAQGKVRVHEGNMTASDNAFTDMPDLFSQELEPSATPPVVLVGCAGWSLSSAVAPQFRGEGSHLERYARVLPAVEINSSFYRPHRAATYARWRDSVPASFRFSVKLPKEITHVRRLQDVGQEIDVFLDAACHLGDRFGCLLVQMPPSLAFDAGSATNLFARLRERLGAAIACEPRHQSWFGGEAAALLAGFDVARVLADPQVAIEPAPALYEDVVYVRLHGSPVIYHSDYSADYLKENAARLIEQHRQGRQVWCIFDNTASGAAVPNALATRKLVGD
jgi:uncharacterized protein YecE (DUF72 family)